MSESFNGKKFYEDGLHFQCQQCSHCCRSEPGYVYLSKSDLTKLLVWAKLNKEEFIEKYCRFVPYYDGSEVLCLLEKPGYDCIFWENGGCTAYEARPLQCSTYPFWSFLLESKEMWDAEADACPGINQGILHGKEEIEHCLRVYNANDPLRKGEI